MTGPGLKMQQHADGHRLGSTQGLTVSIDLSSKSGVGTSRITGSGYIIAKLRFQQENAKL